MKTVFETSKIGSMELQNRIMRTACGDSHGVNGHITEGDIALYRELADGEIGAVITGYTYVSDYGMSEDIDMFGIYDDSFIDEYKILTNAVHEKHSKILMQLVHLGSASMMKDVRIFAPSRVENAMTKTMPEEMTLEDIHHVQSAFAAAVARAKAAGFDGIELHAAHGFLINQFISPHYNHRTDEYGGDTENLSRFAVETVRAIREAVGNSYPVLIKVQSEETFEDGITTEDFIKTCKLLEMAGASAIEVSGPWMTYKQKEPYFEKAAGRLSESVHIPVMLTGGIRDIATAERIVNDTGIAYIGMCRPFINNPYVLKEWKNGTSNISVCVS